MIDHELLKKALDVKLVQGANLRINKVNNGWNIRITAPPITIPKKTWDKSFREILIEAGFNDTHCIRCGQRTYCNPHHIILKSAGGRDDPDNGIFLCFNCHVGDEGVHLHKWKIEEIVTSEKLFELKQKYGLIK